MWACIKRGGGLFKLGVGLCKGGGAGHAIPIIIDKAIMLHSICSHLPIVVYVCMYVCTCVCVCVCVYVCMCVCM